MQPDPVLASYRPPSQLVLDKEIDHLDVHCRALVGLSPFLTLATADADGFPEVSPRGGDPGFVKVLDEHRLVLPDRQGNNRLDSLRNIVADPRVAFCFLLPGVPEAMRVNGRAVISTDPALCARFAFRGQTPRTVLVTTVEAVYFQCAK